MLNKKKTSMTISLVVIMALISLVVVLYLLTKQPQEFWNKIIYSGFIPRGIAWTFLLSGVYGLSRRRFSMSIVIFFFSLAFFFAYIGKFIIPEIY
jgi:hypothetical protein